MTVPNRLTDASLSTARLLRRPVMNRAQVPLYCTVIVLIHSPGSVPSSERNPMFCICFPQRRACACRRVARCRLHGFLDQDDWFNFPGRPSPNSHCNPSTPNRSFQYLSIAAPRGALMLQPIDVRLGCLGQLRWTNKTKRFKASR